MAFGEAAEVIRMETVGILGLRDALSHDLRIDVCGQRQLHEDPIDALVGVEPTDEVDELGGGALGGRRVEGEVDARALGGATLVAHVDRRGRVVAAEDHGERRRRAAVSGHGDDFRGELLPELRGDRLAVDDDCAHL